MVDMAALVEELGGDYPKSYKAHKGMLKSAINLKEKLLNGNLLQEAFSREVRSILVSSAFVQHLQSAASDMLRDVTVFKLPTRDLWS